jgi:hypothetical protein
MSVIALTSRHQIQGMAGLALPGIIVTRPGRRGVLRVWRSRLVIGLAAIARFRWQADQVE